MEDREIVALYLARSEDAVPETAGKYGARCLSLARNLLDTDEDAQECVNDAYLEAWNSIPPARPENLGAWLCRVTRNLAVDRYRKSRRQKRYAGMELLLDELGDCVPDGPEADVEETFDARELGRAIGNWLRAQSPRDRTLFVRRYSDGEPLNRLAEACGEKPQKLAKKMLRLRLSLKEALEKEGYTV